MQNAESDTGEQSDDAYIVGEIVPVTALRGEGTLTVPEVPPHIQVAGAWLAAQDSDNTEKAYRRDITGYFTYCADFSVDPVRAIRPHLDGYRRHLEGLGLAKATRARKLAAVSSFYRYGRRTFPAVIAANPVEDVKRPKPPKRSTSGWLTRDEVDRLIVAADAEGLWHGALVRIMVYTGVRVSELCGARADDLRVVDGCLTMLVDRKGGEDERVAVPADAADVLNRHLAGRTTGPLFLNPRGQRIRRDEVAYQLAKLRLAAGVSTHLTPHVLRHTAGTLTRKAGRDIRAVQKLLGHARIETSVLYEHTDEEIANSPSHDVARYIRGES